MTFYTEKSNVNVQITDSTYPPSPDHQNMLEYPEDNFGKTLCVQVNILDLFYLERQNLGTNRCVHVENWPLCSGAKMSNGGQSLGEKRSNSSVGCWTKEAVAG